MREINLPREIKDYLNNYMEDIQILEKMRNKPVTIVDMDKFIDNFPFVLHSENIIFIYNVDRKYRKAIKRLNLKNKTIVLFQDYISVADFYYAYILSEDCTCQRIEDIVNKLRDYPILKSIDIRNLSKKNCKNTDVYLCYSTVEVINSNIDSPTIQYMSNIENHIRKYCRRIKDIMVSTPKAKIHVAKTFIDVRSTKSLVN